ncbi:MAG: hypothetical protein AAF602_27255 [Myxococcota bacterium]
MTLLAPVLLVLASLMSCLVVVDDDGVIYDCRCDAVYDDYFYYDLYDTFDTIECADPGSAFVVADRVAFDCVDYFSYGYAYYAACDCICTESIDRC